MPEKKQYKFRIKFPGDLEYIPAVRKFVSEVLVVNKYSTKCAFRSEIIIDEICNNAVTYGCLGEDASVEVQCLISPENIQFQVKDSGGREEDVKKLQAVVADEKKINPSLDDKKSTAGLGLEIVRLLSDEVDFKVDENNLTSIRVVRKREHDATTEAKNER